MTTLRAMDKIFKLGVSIGDKGYNPNLLLTNLYGINPNLTFVRVYRPSGPSIRDILKTVDISCGLCTYSDISTGAKLTTQNRYFLNHFDIPLRHAGKINIQGLVYIGYNSGVFLSDRERCNVPDELIDFYHSWNLGKVETYL